MKQLPKVTFSLGGHRNLTILLVVLILFVAGCVYYVNKVVLTPGTDDAYQSQAETNAQLINFNQALLKQAQTFTSNANSTSLPAGRTNPFSH